MSELLSVQLTGTHTASLQNFMIADLDRNVSLRFEPYSFWKSQLWKLVLHRIGGRLKCQNAVLIIVVILLTLQH